MKIERQYSLKSLNTLGVLSYAEYFAMPENASEIKDCLQFAQQKNLAVKVLGGGSNVVMAKLVEGLVLHYRDESLQVVSEDHEKVTIEVGAGFQWHGLVMETLKRGWFGLENLALIPGTVGAAPVQNIGAYGVEVKDFITAVHGVYLKDGSQFKLLADECAFAYRESIFKGDLDSQILITSVEFILSKQKNVVVDYAPLKQMAEQQGLPTPAVLAQWVVDVRSEKLPDPNVLPNAGSFFKNPLVSLVLFNKLIALYPQMPNYPQGDVVKLPAGWLIDQLGLKGVAFGPVSVHKKQALVLINQGGSGEQVMAAAAEIKKRVLSAYEIQLEQEPRMFK